MKYSQHHDALIPFAKIDTIPERRSISVAALYSSSLWIMSSDDDVMQQLDNFTEGHA